MSIMTSRGRTIYVPTYFNVDSGYPPYTDKFRRGGRDLFFNIDSTSGVAPKPYRLPNLQRYEKLRDTSARGIAIDFSRINSLNGEYLQIRGAFGGNIDVSDYHTEAGFALNSQGFMESLPVYDRLLTKAYRKLKGNDLNLSVDIAEISQVKNLIRDLCKRLWSILKDVKRLALTKVGESLSKAIADVWLSFQYGWKPLLSSIFGLLENTRRKLNFLKISARTSISQVVDFTARPYELPTGVCRSWLSSRGEMVWFVKTPSTDLAELSKIASLNPVSVIWEIVPFSFVVDWFVNVSKWLSHMEASVGAGLEFVSGYWTYTFKNRHVVKTAAFDTYGPFTLITPMEFKAYHSYKKRTVLSDFPRPELPGFEIDLGASQIMSLVSLIRQRFSF